MDQVTIQNNETEYSNELRACIEVIQEVDVGKKKREQNEKYYAIKEENATADERQQKNENEKISLHLIRRKRFRCDHCAYVTPDKSRITIHLRKHTGEKPFSCSNCSFTCAHSATLRNHMFLHSEKKYKCEICGHKSSILSSHRNHMQLIHTVEKKFACHSCSYRGKTKKSLKVHELSHSPHLQCPHCSYKTYRNSKLNQHIAAHSRDMGEEGSFECALCQYKGYTAYSVTKHMKENHGDFECDVCGDVLEGRGKFKEHKKFHEIKTYKRFLCDKCDYTVGTRDSLNRHIRLKHATGPDVEECSHCSKTFSVKKDYESHLKSHDAGCKLCKIDLHTKHNLKRHNKAFHSTNSHETTEENNVALENKTT